MLINGGLNNQTLAGAGDEADLDVQFALDISYPTPGTFYSTGGRAPFIKDVSTPNATNEPYGDWLDFALEQHSIPQVISTKYTDEEQSKVSPWITRAVYAEVLLSLAHAVSRCSLQAMGAL